MSADLDLVRSLYADWERGDFSRSDWIDPEIEWVNADGPSPGSWRGRSGLAEGWRDFLHSWEDYRAQAEAFRELDSERVLSLTHSSGRGRASGVDMRLESAALFQLSGGRVTKVTNYFDRARALLALEEQPVSEESTTPDLVRLARQGYEAMSRGDLARVMSVFAADAVLDMSAAGFGPSRARRRSEASWRTGVGAMRTTGTRRRSSSISGTAF